MHPLIVRASQNSKRKRLEYEVLCCGSVIILRLSFGARNFVNTGACHTAHYESHLYLMSL